MKRNTAMLSLVAAMALTGANVPLAKLLLASMPPGILLPMRFALAVAALALLARYEQGPRLSALGRRQWGAVAVLGVVGSVLFTWFVLEGVQRTSGASAGIILAALPAVVAIAAYVRGERLRTGEVAMIVLAVAGVALVQTQPMPQAGPASSGLGNLLIACAVACEAAFVIVARGVSSEIGPLRLSLAVAFLSLLVCLPAGASQFARFDWRTLEPRTAALFIWYAMTASVVCTALWYRGVAHVETWAAGLATTAVPVAALAVSVLLLGEPLSATQCAGAGLVIAAIAVGMLSRRKPA